MQVYRCFVRPAPTTRRKIDRIFKADHAVTIPLTVREILEEQIARKLAWWKRKSKPHT